MAYKPKSRYLTKAQKAAAMVNWAKEYTEDGDSIRTIAKRHGCSYGKVHRVLTLARVELRPRGGGMRRKNKPEDSGQ